MKQYFFFNVFRKTIVQFFDAFNDIKIARYAADGLTVDRYIEVPIKHSIKEKVSPQFVKVRCAKLDDILNHIGVEKVDFIKIDVEGAEVEVLEGAQEIITKSDSLEILVEISNKKI